MAKVVYSRASGEVLEAQPSVSLVVCLQLWTVPSAGVPFLLPEPPVLYSTEVFLYEEA